LLLSKISLQAGLGIIKKVKKHCFYTSFEILFTGVRYDEICLGKE